MPHDGFRFRSTHPTLAALLNESRLTLMSDAQDAHDIVGRVIAVQSDVAGTAVGDDQFTAKWIALAADQRMAGKNRNGGLNVRDDLTG